MRTESVITSKFQVTIPKGVRDELDLKEGERVSFVVEQGRIHLVRIPKDIVGAMKNLVPGSFPDVREEIRRDRKQW